MTATIQRPGVIVLPTVPGGFRVVYADPAWRFAAFSEKGLSKSPQAHYDCMPLDAIKAMPVADVCAKDAALFMWATWPMLPQALEVMADWGFTYKTGASWGKLSSTGAKLAFGTGYIFRSASEPLLVGTRGKPKWPNHSERGHWNAPIREHSRKPDAVIEAIERMCAGPRLELNARQRRPGWEAWGNQIDHFAEAA